MSVFPAGKFSKKSPYTAAYYAREGPASSEQSAKLVVPLITSAVRPESVVDVGCGSGSWLAAFRERGVQRILGLDGDHVDPTWLRISPDCFRAMDLSKPFRLDQEFDLAVCLEVAEHLPKKCAAQFVQSLVRLAPTILFSAAVPFQGGTHHVNEQWPPYWQTMFARHDYRMLDLVRKEIWKRPEIKYWYRQNIFLFVREDLIPSRPCFREAIAYPDDLLLVHPDILQRQMGVRSLLKHLPGSVWRAARHIKQRLLSTS